MTTTRRRKPEPEDARLAAFDLMREALRAAVEWFWGASPETMIESHDRVAAEFYSDTGVIAPGKSVPLAMNPPWTEDERRAAWDAWVKRRRDALENGCRAALAAADKAARGEP